MHNIQRKILGKLLYAVSLPYAAMRPEGVESNHFAYHLEQLVRAGYITKHARQYTLSPQGLQLIDRMSQEGGMRDRLQPHIVTNVVLTNEQGQQLLFKRFFQPYINQYSFILGKTHYEESLMEAASREVYEKTGLTDITLQNRGVVYLTTIQEGVVIGKKLCHVLSGSVTGTPAVAPLNPARGECLWIDSTTLKPEQCMPGVGVIKQLLDAHGDELFFGEYTEETPPTHLS